MANDLVKRHIVTTDSEDSLARATAHRANDEVNGGAPAPEDQPAIESSSESTVLDLSSIRSQAAANVQAREKERLMNQQDGKPQIITKDNKRNKAKK